MLAHTHVVVPVSARGVVSYSMPDRPGASYINLRGKSRADLADDLLHETAHHRLHDLEELSALERDDGEPRYVSPWRRGVRPLRGILHAAYTFTWRAELLRRMRDARTGAPGAWLRREMAFEIDALSSALGDLADASRRGLLTPAGERLRRALVPRVRALGR